MATIRLPQVGSDEGQWGQLLNDYLTVEHNADGTLKKSDDIDAKYEKPSSGIPASDLASGVQGDLQKGASSVQTVNGVAPTAGAVTLTAASLSAIPTSDKAAANGVATLDSSSKLQTAQLPTTAALKTDVLNSSNIVKRSAMPRGISIRGARQIADMWTNAVMSTPPTFDTKITGLNTTTLLTSTGITGATARTCSLADTSIKNDPRYQIVGPFKYLFGNTGQVVGAWQATRPGPTIGASGIMGSVAFDFYGDKFEIRMRDLATNNYIWMFVSEEGGPLQPIATNSQTAPHVTITNPGDNLYFLQPVTFSTVKQRTIVIVAECCTFGGVNAHPTHTVSRPSIKIRSAIAMTDSYGVPAGTPYRTPLSLFSQAIFGLGFLPHVSGYGGTGFLADNGQPASVYNYNNRRPHEIDPYYDLGNENGVQPAFWIAAGTQNDSNTSLNGSPSTSAVRTAAATLFDTFQTNFPGVPGFTSTAQRMYRGNTTNNNNDILVATQMLAASTTKADSSARTDVIPVFDPCGNASATTGVAALVGGTGYQGATTGDGASDLFVHTDASHPNREGARWLAHYWRQRIANTYEYGLVT